MIVTSILINILLIPLLIIFLVEKYRYQKRKYGHKEGKFFLSVRGYKIRRNIWKSPEKYFIPDSYWKKGSIHYMRGMVYPDNEVESHNICNGFEADESILNLNEGRDMRWEIFNEEK